MIITDQAMRGIAGTSIAVELSKLCQGTPMILLSRRGAEVGQDTMNDLGTCPSLVKPFKPVELAKAVREALDDG